MKVSITLHTDEPSADGNQREFEAKYRDFNRAYGTLEMNANGKGDAVLHEDSVKFPPVGADPDKPYTHFSIGVCEGVPLGHGGAIILTAPIGTGPLTADVDFVPQLFNLHVGVYASRIAEMRADGRMGAGD